MKVANFRYCFFAFIAFAFASIFCYSFLDFNIVKISFCAVCLIVFLIACFKFKLKKIFCVIMSVFVVGCFLTCINYHFFIGSKIVGDVAFCGNVESVSVNSSVTNVNIQNVKIGSSKLNNGVYVTIIGEIAIEAGDNVCVYGTLENIKASDLVYNYRKNIGKTSSVYSYNVQVVSHTKYIDNIVKNSLSAFLKDKVDNNTNSIICGILLGDKAMIQNGTKNAFTNSGTGHLLVISGLHISIIIAIFAFVLKKCKLNHTAIFFVMLFLLLVYCYICGFAPSVLRASIMGLCGLFALVIGEKYDRLNVLGISGLIILLFKPLYVVDAGFLLSYASVFSIFTIMPLLINFLTKFKFPKFCVAPLALVFSIQIGLTPLLCCYFGTFNIFSFFVNLIAVPFFEFIFVFTFFAIFATLLLPFLKFLLEFVEFGFALLQNFCGYFASINFANLNIPTFQPFALFPFYFGTFVCSNYIFVKKKCKIITYCASVAMFLCLCVIIDLV